MITEFAQRVAAMPEMMVQVTYAAMVLGAQEAKSARSFTWFDDRVQVARKELEKRHSQPRPLPAFDPASYYSRG